MNLQGPALSVAALLAATVLVVGCASLPTRTGPGEGGRRVELALDGAGATVVFQSGLGDGLAAWSPVWSMLAGSARLLAYHGAHRRSDADAPG